MGRSSLEQLVRKSGVAAVFEGEPGQEDPVEEALEQGWNAAPPDRVNEGQVIRPENLLLCLQQVGLKCLDFLVTLMQDRIEIQCREVQQANLVACFGGGFDIGVGQRGTKAVG